MANKQCQRLNLSGYSFVGSDIGGFLDKTNGELFTRWIQLGIFHPFCRVHSSGEHGNQEPWSFGEPYTAIVRKFIELRYRLLPYFYTAFHQHIETGDPILRPLLYLDHTDPQRPSTVPTNSRSEIISSPVPFAKKAAKAVWDVSYQRVLLQLLDRRPPPRRRRDLLQGQARPNTLFIRAGAVIPDGSRAPVFLARSR